MNRDYLPIVEAAYCAVRSDAAWLTAIANATRKTLDHGLGVYAVRYDCRGGVNVPMSAEAGIRSALWRSIGIARTLFSPIQAARVYNCAVPVLTLSHALLGNELREEIWGDYMFSHGVSDFLMVRAGDESQTGIITAVPLPSKRAMPGPRTVAALGHIAGELLAAWRMRRRQSSTLSEAMTSVTAEQFRDLAAAGGSAPLAVLERMMFKIEHSEVHQLDRIEALRARDSLILGDWVVVQRGCDAAGNLLLMARRSQKSGNPAKLSNRERVVAVAAAAGVPMKAIAIDLGVAATTVSEHLSRAMNKLRVVSRRELAALLFQGERFVNTRQSTILDRSQAHDDCYKTLHACLFHVDNDEYILFVIDPRLRLKLDVLTPVERHIVGLMIAGATNIEIARARRTKPQTVANQIRHVFEKLAVSSRAHLIAACVTGDR
jgi:DNA-binding CsgD family transcriptional regulator